MCVKDVGWLKDKTPNARVRRERALGQKGDVL